LNWTEGATHTALWTNGYAKGATQITLNSTAALSVGSAIILDQENDAADTGGVYVCDADNTCATDTSASPNPSSPGRFVPGAGVPPAPSDPSLHRNQLQIAEVTAINGLQVTISPGLHMPNWRASQNPGAWWASTQATLNGIEDLAIDNTLVSNQVAGIIFFNAYRGWVRNVKSIKANRAHVMLELSARIEVRDCYFYETQNHASESYGIETFMSYDDLVINNIFEHVTTPILEGNSSGSVFAYNFAIYMDYSLNPDWMMPSAFAHDAGTGMNLHESNEFTGYIQDNIHGSHNFGTVFRNRFVGWEEKVGTPPPNNYKTLQTNPIVLMAHSRYANLVGNILGTWNYHTVYEDSSVTGENSSPDESIYLLGYAAAQGGSNANMPYDIKVASTLLRWGNFDHATSQIHWDPAEIPPGNAVPANQSLPPSFFLSSSPSWWGTMPWPAIGPDVNGGPEDVSGHVYKIPAHVCYDATPRDGTGSPIFNANNCY
jgi:hypothetical protein